VIKAFSQVSGQNIPYRIMARRTGDIAKVWADTQLAWKVLEWTAIRGLEEMCRDAWAWQQKHPNGY